MIAGASSCSATTRLSGPELERFAGREVDTAGDGFLSSFEAPGQAVRCAAAVVEAVGLIGLSVRAGVHTGECVRVGDKLEGVAVHIGARVCAEAGPSEVLVSSTVRDLLAGSGLAFADRGLRVLKGIPGDWRLYSVELRSRDVAVVPARIQLCGRVVIELDGRRVEGDLPGRQGKVLFAYLAANRRRPVGRDELMDALWPSRNPKAVESSLSALLSKLRRALGPERLDGRSSLQLQLPEHSWMSRVGDGGDPSRGVRAHSRGLARGMVCCARDPAHRPSSLPAR